MYAFMYVNPETILVEDYFTATQTFVENYGRISTPGPVPKCCFRFSFMCSEYYELDMNFDKI